MWHLAQIMNEGEDKNNQNYNDKGKSGGLILVGSIWSGHCPWLFLGAEVEATLFDSMVVSRVGGGGGAHDSFRFPAPFTSYHDVIWQRS